MRVAAHFSSLDPIPVDFFADPDGRWDYEGLARAVAFDACGATGGQLSIGALTKPYAGFPEGAAVVLLSAADGCAIALVDCTSSGEAAAA